MDLCICCMEIYNLSISTMTGQIYYDQFLSLENSCSSFTTAPMAFIIICLLYQQTLSTSQALLSLSKFLPFINYIHKT
jgi:hypothetical protein